MARTTVQSELIATNAISGTIIADGAITSTHLAANSVDTAELVTGSIDTIHIAANNVTAAKIVSDGIETRHLHSNVISGLSEVAVATGDFILLGDTSDSNNLKKAPISSILAGTLTTAAQTNITSLGTLTGLTGGTGDFNWDSGTLFVDSSANAVGIGTTSPAFENGTGLEIRYAGGNGAHLKLTDNASGTGGSQGFDLYMFNGQAYIENYEDNPTIFRNNGGETMRILADGKVGIGDSSPDNFLDVDFDITGEGSNEGGIKIQNSHGVNNDFAPLYFGVHGGTRRTKAAIGLKRTGSYGIGDLVFAMDANGDDANVTFANDEVMRITSAGNVGIGTISPIEKMHVHGQVMSSASNSTSATAGVERAIIDLSSHIARVGHFRGTESAGSGEMSLWTDSVERVRIDQNGYVGIGTDSPGYHFEPQASRDNNWISRIYNTHNNGYGLLVRTDCTSANNKMVLGVYADSAYRMAVLAGGNVGIGTTAPASHYGFGKTFEVQGGANAEINLSQTDNSKNWSMGIVNGSNYQQTDNSNYIWESGGTTRMTIDANGYVTQPSQPVAIYTHSASSEAGAYAYNFGGTGATQVTCKPQGAVVNRGSMYNASNGRFTAPVAGIYRYAVHGNLYTNGLHANAYWTYRIYKNGGHYLYHYQSNSVHSANAWQYQNASGLILLAKDDYIQFELKTNNLLSNNFGMDLSNYTHYEFALLY